MSIPDTFSYFLKRLANVRRNTTRISAVTSTTANSGDTVVVRLPSNAIVNLQTFNWFFTSTCETTTGFCRLPRNVESIIDNVSILINGLAVHSSQLRNYNEVFNILLNCTSGSDYKAARAILQNSSDVLTPAANQVASFCINDWLGFFNAQPQYIDTALTGDVEIQIRLAPNTILPISAGATGAKYTLSNMFFTIDTVSFLTNDYDQMMENKMNQGAVLEIPFQNYLVFNQSLVSSFRVALNSRCVNMLLSTNFLDNRTTGAITSNGQSVYFKYTNGNASTYQWQVDAVNMPSQSVECDSSKPYSYQYVQQTFNDHNNVLGFNLLGAVSVVGSSPASDSIAAYINNNFVVALNLNVSGSDNRLLSGYDSAGSNSQIFLNYTSSGSLTTNASQLMIALCTSVLRVSAGRILEVVV